MKTKGTGEETTYQVYKTRGARRRRRTFILVGIFVFLIVAAVAVAGGSYWWFSSKVSAANGRASVGVKEALSAAPSTTLVSIPQSPDSMNLVLLGSDTRENSLESSGRSDTIMVVHVDFTEEFASILSVPRDLWVEIQGHGSNKINAAYAYGGPELTIRTVKNLLGLNITKYAELNFVAFQTIVDSLGGVYIDVDRRYKDASPRPIDLHAGYQLLNGADALNFARYRFDSNIDFGRMTRQQRVIAAIREQAMGWNLPLKLPGLIDGALSAVATNLSATEMLKLGNFLIKLDGSHIRQLVVPAEPKKFGESEALVADKASLKQSVTDLLTAPSDDSESSTTTAKGVATTTATTETSSNDSRVIALAAKARRVVNSDMWESAQAKIPFKLQAPGFIPRDLKYAYKTPASTGTYQIDPDGDSKPAVRMLYQYKTGSLYVGITATTWTDAPIASPGQEIEANGVTYTVVGTSGKVDHIWWETDGVLYFISNTLMYNVSKKDLVEMAKSMAPVETGD